MKIHMFFRNKDAKNNFQKEDENTTIYRDGLLEMDALHLKVLTNLCVCYNKRKDIKKVLEMADEALKIDHRDVKALYQKGKANFEECDYEDAIKNFEDLLEFDPENVEAARELEKVKKANDTYKSKEKLLYQMMFG